MSADGTLNWTPPPGRWTILRFGYSLTGISNHPASPEGTGPEVDKLSREDVRDYMQQYLDSYKSAVGDLMGKRGLQYLISDSYEAGAANWTNALVAELAKRRGYDMHPWMPVLWAGRPAESSDRFLWDFRKTLTELIAENHYDQITEILHQRGMGHYGESHETGRAFIGDGMEAKRTKDVPMAAMWTQKPGVNNELYGYDADIRESASVAHIYGQNLVAAESMTASSGAGCGRLRPTAVRNDDGPNAVIHVGPSATARQCLASALGLSGNGSTARNLGWMLTGLPIWRAVAIAPAEIRGRRSVLLRNSNLTAIFANRFPTF
jgi:hypothetical protein